MASIWISVLLLTLIRNAVSDYDPTVCKILERNKGLIPPPLPINFELKAEHVDHDKNSATYEEMYFDFTNSRAKYKYLLDSFEYNYLFDYDTQQIVEWIKVHPGTSMKRDPLSHRCEAVNMEESPQSFLFGYKDWIYEHPKMFNSFQVLRYGGQYLYAADGTEILYDRNLKVNKFIGCLYDPFINGTMSNDYYFADTDAVQPSGGTPSSVVTGSDLKPLSVPVKLHAEGRYYVGNENHSINKTTSISYFKGEPQFEMGTFQIPPWIYCDKYRGRKEIPKLPTAFSTRVTISSFLIDTLGQLQEEASSESYEEIYYDSDKNLARRDFTPNRHIDKDIYDKFGNYAPVSTIYDFNEGLRYTINKPSGRCYIIPIPENDYFDTEEHLIYRKLATPEEVFLLQKDDMEYKGKAFARDIKCDVWNGKHYHEKFRATFVKETYFSTDGWHEIVDGTVEYGGVPVRNVLIKKELDGNAEEGISTYDFLKFKRTPPKVDSFNIKNCVELIDHKRFAIELTLNDCNNEQIVTYKFLFLEAAQLYIANKTGVNTPLRIQRLHLRHQSISSTRVFLIFSLLEKANLRDFEGAIGQKGKDLQEAILLLQKVVDAGNFSVQFKDPKTNEIIAVQAEARSLYSLTASGYLTPMPLKPATLREQKSEDIVSETKVTYEEHAGMTSGHLALLAFAMLFIGIGIGIAIMYLYQRMYGERQVDDRITLTTTLASSAGGSRDPGQETP